MITLNKISKRFPNKVLFDDVTITFNSGLRYGLTGPNGAGKSTLLKIIMGLEEASSGTVSLPPRVGILKQNIDDVATTRLIDVVIMGNKRLWEAIKERDALEQVEITDEVGIRLGDLEGVIAEEEGYAAEANAEELLAGVGVDSKYYYEPMNKAPLDDQFKALLCQALFGTPQALLLDEPTNHLDLESIRWLEGVLHDYKGTLIVVSHDRHFLNAVTTHIADIDYDTIIVYPGNYDEMIVMKSDASTRSAEENKSKEKKIAQLKEFVAKFGAGTRASQVQSRLREIERLQPQELKKSNISRPYIRFLTPEKPSGQIVFSVENLSKQYTPDHPLIKNLSLEIHRGDKLGVIGPNGHGKTTFVKMLAGVLAPDAGKITLGHQTQIGYFPQNHHDIIDKKQNMQLFDWLRMQKAGIYDQEIRAVLGKMLFAGDDAFKLIPQLSGGETARLILAAMMLRPDNTLILDEPNNHLDLEAVSALGWGLKDFKGTVVVVSHDRDLIGTVANKILSFEDNKITFFDGPLEEYLIVKGKNR